MTEAKPPAPRSQNVVPVLRRMGEAVKMIFGLVESIEQLRAKNAVLTAEVDELRREVDQQAGQVMVLMQFVRSALDDRVEKRAAAAARRIGRLRIQIRCEGTAQEKMKEPRSPRVS